MSEHDLKFYIGGQWVDPQAPKAWDVVNPATEERAGRISLGSVADVDRAVAAARAAFPAFSALDRHERIALLERIVAACEKRREDMAQAITREMGSPITFSREVQVGGAIFYFKEMARVLQSYEFERMMGSALIRREAIGICGMITPWNWPINQIASKLAAALAAGCTVVVKPSEFSPLSAIIFAEALHDAGVPSGVFNLVNGDGPTVGEAIARHPDIDMVSFTGSTRAGILVAKAAAETVKRVTQELGGKSANIVLPDADLERAVTQGVLKCFANTGQSCQAPTRMLVHRSQRDEAVALALRAAERMQPGDPQDPASKLGPVVNLAQFSRVQAMIEKGIAEGGTLVCGGPGRPSGFNRGYYVRPTIIADVTPDMTVAREEIFGPVLAMMNYDTEDEAVSIANDTPYGLAGYIYSTDIPRARRLAERIRAGRVYLNDSPSDRAAPFGGYKQSGNGRELGVFGLEEYLEVKAVIGYIPDEIGT